MSETTISIGEKAIEKSKFSGWSVVASAMLIVFFHMMIRGSFATLLQSMVASTGWSTGTVAAGSSIFMAMYGLFAFLVGTYINKLGCRLTYSLHGIIMGVGLFLCSYSQQPWQYWLSYAIIGIGSGAFWAPVTSMVRQWFIDKLGLAMGLTTAASGMAMFLGPIISMLIISKLSWQIMMKVFGVVLIVGIVAAAQFTKMKPEDVGQKPLGYDTFMAKMNAGERSEEGSSSMFPLSGLSSIRCFGPWPSFGSAAILPSSSSSPTRSIMWSRSLATTRYPQRTSIA